MKNSDIRCVVTVINAALHNRAVAGHLHDPDEARARQLMVVEGRGDSWDDVQNIPDARSEN